MRIGKNVEHFKAAAIAADSKNMDPVLKYCAVGRQLGYATYLTLDTITFVGLPEADLYHKTESNHSSILQGFAHLQVLNGCNARRIGDGSLV